jgi:hypothetical protein
VPWPLKTTTGKGFGDARPGEGAPEFSRDKTDHESGILHLKPGTLPETPQRGICDDTSAECRNAAK